MELGIWSFSFGGLMAYFQVRFLLVSGRVYNHLEIHQINIQHVHMLRFSEILFVLLYLVTWSLLLTFHFSKAYIFGLGSNHPKKLKSKNPNMKRGWTNYSAPTKHLKPLSNWNKISSQNWDEANNLKCQCEIHSVTQIQTSWWFQPLWNILVNTSQNGPFPQNWG